MTIKHEGIKGKYTLIKHDRLGAMGRFLLRCLQALGAVERRRSFSLVEGHPWTRDALLAVAGVTAETGFERLGGELHGWANELPANPTRL